MLIGAEGHPFLGGCGGELVGGSTIEGNILLALGLREGTVIKIHLDVFKGVVQGG